jgi:hypothetical protein
MNRFCNRFLSRNLASPSRYLCLGCVFFEETAEIEEVVPPLPVQTVIFKTSNRHFIDLKEKW